MNAALILASLERAGDLCPDPAPRIYQRLFAMHPALEALFVMDRDGGVRASMLVTCLNIIIGLAEGSPTARFLVSAGRLHHEGYGVPDGQFDAMFIAMRDTFRQVMGAEWTPDVDAAWDGLLAEIAAIA